MRSRIIHRMSHYAITVRDGEYTCVQRLLTDRNPFHTAISLCKRGRGNHVVTRVMLGREVLAEYRKDFGTFRKIA